MTTLTDQEKRARLHRGPTRYELVVERGDIRIRIAYTARQGRHVMLTAMREHGPKLLKFMGIGEDDLLVWLRPVKLGAHIGPADNPWKIRYSGRTQRECIGSELQWIGSIEQE